MLTGNQYLKRTVTGLKLSFGSWHPWVTTSSHVCSDAAAESRQQGGDEAPPFNELISLQLIFKNTHQQEVQCWIFGLAENVEKHRCSFHCQSASCFWSLWRRCCVSVHLGNEIIYVNNFGPVKECWLDVLLGSEGTGQKNISPFFHYDDGWTWKIKTHINQCVYMQSHQVNAGKHSKYSTAPVTVTSSLQSVLQHHDY